jgi:uncharacterized protein YcfJ
MKTLVRRTLVVLAVVASSQAMADAVFYQGERFDGATFAASRSIPAFDDVFAHRRGDRRDDRDHDRDRDRGRDRGHARDGAASAVVFGERWEVCDAPAFHGRCKVLRPGRYPSPETMGLRYRVSSARTVPKVSRIDDARFAPRPVSVYDDRRRRNERLFEARVISARAVYGVEERRCWLEREQVEAPRARGNGAGAVVGAILGGILGHQVGHGSTRDVATVGGAIAGGAVGYNVGRTRNGEYAREVQRCSGGERSARPDYWAVTYVFRGQEHDMQVAYEPGDTVTVNRRGEPRNDLRSSTR